MKTWQRVVPQKGKEWGWSTGQDYSQQSGLSWEQCNECLWPKGSSYSEDQEGDTSMQCNAKRMQQSWTCMPRSNRANKWSRLRTTYYISDAHFTQRYWDNFHKLFKSAAKDPEKALLLRNSSHCVLSLLLKQVLEILKQKQSFLRLRFRNGYVARVKVCVWYSFTCQIWHCLTPCRGDSAHTARRK